ncbi:MULTISPECIES: CSLREA domain-containing protein [Acinetobacter]|uniref:CSLREA domain-containing protein n=1 Tax=Acinetobacter TaxID=469 RepID=UPI000C654FFE|nr:MULTISPECIES: CSLREA domain-containing protein [Acinetobacter]MBC70044.1 hypothetical protein [Acinetobacter sp.]MBT50326.1 hypothetical protein [Acinetobacter sp.]HIQ35711.1 CSLREA domain-containing protein [Acinetobacter venetianus]HJP46267.1 CSLREA domain-containing protein [Acinetobacter venetianus]
MKNYKKGILATMVIASMPLIAATSSDVIKVTTFVDEDGENTNACSLREALKTAELRKSYGGCSITDTLSTTTKQIQLEAGTYTLTKELVPMVNVLIIGATPVNWEKKNVITNQYPAQKALESIIDAQKNSRIFNTTVANKTLSLNSVVLKNGQTSDRGGSIYAGADVSLLNSQILDSSANIAGGAIFLAGPSASLTITSSLISNNTAPLATVVGMSCFNDNVYSKRTISINNSSLINNGSNSSSSMLEFCGQPATTLSTNTIAKNIVNTSNGSLIKFSGDTKAGSDSNNGSSILSNASSLNLLSNTIVENTANTIFLYDKLGSKSLSFNILSHNNNTSACRYLLGDAAELESMKMSANYNAIERAGSKKCDLPKEAFPTEDKNIDVSGISDVRSILSDLSKQTEYTAFLPMYYPKKDSVLIDVSKAGADGCSESDQRGIARIADGTLYFNPEERNSCDVGSVELMKFTAGDLEDLSNTSISTLVTGYQQQVDNYEYLVENPDDPKYETYDKENLEIYKNLLEKTKDNLHYRAIYIDLKNYQLPLPEEIELSDGTHKLQFFDKSLYKVTTKALGVGQINDSEYTVQEDENLICEWNNDLAQIIMYRKDDTITQAGDKEFCQYTIESNDNSNVKSTGLIKAAFNNIAPEAKDTSVTLKYQQKEKVALDLLKFSNDNGDTGEGGKGPDDEPNKPAFWKNEDGIELPIRLSNVPSKNILVTADREGKCPKPDDSQTCYGGNIYIQEANAFNPFNYSFNYQVYDADGIASNTATVSVISTATTTDDTRSASNGGGGSIGWLSLLGLFGLLGYRRMKK